jgi:hypothetical protein
MAKAKTKKKGGNTNWTPPWLDKKPGKGKPATPKKRKK